MVQSDPGLPAARTPADQVKKIEKRNGQNASKVETADFVPEKFENERITDQMRDEQMEKHQKKITLIVFADASADEETVMIANWNRLSTDVAEKRTRRIDGPTDPRERRANQIPVALPEEIEKKHIEDGKATRREFDVGTIDRQNNEINEVQGIEKP